MHFVLLLAAVLAVVCAARDYVPQRGDFTISTEVCYRCDNDDPSDCVADSIIIRLTDGVGRTTTMTTWAEPRDTGHWPGFGGNQQLLGGPREAANRRLLAARQRGGVVHL